MTCRAYLSACAVILVLCVWVDSACAEDWPQWRYDAGHTADSPQRLPTRLYLHWVYKYAALDATRNEAEEQAGQVFSKHCEPIVVGSTIFLGSGLNDRITALDTRTGRERWRFYAGGPVRLSPVVWKDSVCFGGDDGYLYCLNSQTGALEWKVRGGPGRRKVLGNGRLISAWPVRGGPVVRDGVVYFAAGVLPSAGIFVHAVDAETGKKLWSGDGGGLVSAHYEQERASWPGGVPAETALALVGNRLYLPRGGTPVCFDIRNGELPVRGQNIADAGQHGDDGMGRFSAVCGVGEYYFNCGPSATDMRDVPEGRLHFTTEGPVLPVVGKNFFFIPGDSISAYSFERTVGAGSVRNASPAGERAVDGKDKIWECSVDAGAALIKAGNRLYAGGGRVLSALDLRGRKEPVVSWRVRIQGDVGQIVAGDGRLFVTTLDGTVHAFGPEKRKTVTFEPRPVPRMAAPESVRERVERILNTAGVMNGYCLVYGVESGDLAEQLARVSQLDIIAAGGNSREMDMLRSRFDELNIYGSRISCHVGDPITLEAPPHLAVLTVFENLDYSAIERKKRLVKKVLENVRPYGGKACFSFEGTEDRDAFVELLDGYSLPGITRAVSGNNVWLSRQNGPAGSGDWTHGYGNIANNGNSNDRRVKLPLGLLWFAEHGERSAVPRYGYGPASQISGGRSVVAGMDYIAASDVYTGRSLWKRHLPDADSAPDYVVTPDKVYMASGSDCLAMDPATGTTVGIIGSSRGSGRASEKSCKILGVYRDYIIIGRGSRLSAGRRGDSVGVTDPNKRIAKAIEVMNRHSGEMIWRMDSAYGFHSGATVAGGSRLFCLDSSPSATKPVLMALDIRDGTVLWKRRKNVFGSCLAYSESQDILIEYGGGSLDAVLDTASKRMIARIGRNGTVIWDKPIDSLGPCLVQGDVVFPCSAEAEGQVINIFTGEPARRTHPMTGTEIPFRYADTGSARLLTGSSHVVSLGPNSSGVSGLGSMGRTGEFSGLASGLTFDLVAANGVLNAWQYAESVPGVLRKEASFALIHMPDAELWTFGDVPVVGENVLRIERLGLNFGAPGDRMAEDGTLWLDCPSVGGPSPDPIVMLKPLVDGGTKGERKQGLSTGVFRDHASTILTRRLRWIAASGMEGVESIQVPLGLDPNAGVSEDAFSVVWTGFIRPQHSESYTFRVAFDDGVRLWIGGELVIDSWHGRGRSEASGVMKLEAGQKYPFKMHYREHAGEAGVELMWSSASTPEMVIPGKCMFTESGWHGGLTGRYYGNEDFTGVVAGRIDYGISFDWADETPDVIAAFNPSYPDNAREWIYKVSLYFAEPHSLGIGDRVFDVELEGEMVLKDFDTVKEAGGVRRLIVKEFDSVRTGPVLNLSLVPNKGRTLLCGIKLALQ